MKLIINGYARHGKDLVADLFVKNHGLTKLDVSRLVAKDMVEEGYIGNYVSAEECYRDRVNHRDKWYEYIKLKRDVTPDAYFLDAVMRGDIYVGVRSLEEYYTNLDLFDASIWVDASGRGLPKESSESCDLDARVAHDFYIDNSGTIEQTAEQVSAVHMLIQNKDRAIHAYN